MTHSLFLAVAYATACVLWWAISRVIPLWRNPARPTFAHPWREVGFAFLGIVGTIGLGQLWSAGIRLEVEGALNMYAEALNQIIIFTPIMLVPLLRRQGWASAWIHWNAFWLRLSIGIALAFVVLLMFSSLEAGAPPLVDTLRDVSPTRHVHHAVQVLLEDIAIAILFVRVASALGPRRAIAAVALLFAAAHIPAMLANGYAAGDLAGLVRDFGLGIVVLGTVWRSADILWLWPIHYALDMTQFLIS